MGDIVSFKTILAFLDDSDDGPARLEAACKLAEIHGAHLDVLAMTQRIVPYVAAGIGAAAAELDLRQIEQARDDAKKLATKAAETLSRRGQLGDARWISQEVFGLREAAGIFGRQSDLVLAGQPLKDNNAYVREAVFEGALFSSGRPVLLLPANWKGTAEFKNIVVAWDASREAARALSDAAVFIEAAASLKIVIVDPKPGYQGFGEDPGNDIATVLARHCDDVELVRIPSSGKSISQALLTAANDSAADLIVMGGYGHSRLRESVFGGVTRDMLEVTTIPLLMSH
jgi:nucleotide-binding universal stress UspA family protein